MANILRKFLILSSYSGQLYPMKTNFHSSSKFLSILYNKRFQHSIAIKCWKCGVQKQNLNELFCINCKMIQNPEDKNNYFKLMQCHESYDIDFKTLQNKYRSLLSVLHPDKFSNKTVEEKHISEDVSSLVNSAFQILQSPLKRALHLLNLKGEQIREDEKIDDPAFLMEIMELNEEVENATSPEELKKLNQSNKKILGKIEKEISEYFTNNNLEKVKISIIKLRYYNSVSQHINELLRERGIDD